MDAFQEGANEIIRKKMRRAIFRGRQMKNFPKASDMDWGDKSSDYNGEDVEENKVNCRGIAGTHKQLQR